MKPTASFHTLVEWDIETSLWNEYIATPIQIVDINSKL